MAVAVSQDGRVTRQVGTAAQQPRGPHWCPTPLSKPLGVTRAQIGAAQLLGVKDTPPVIPLHPVWVSPSPRPAPRRFHLARELLRARGEQSSAHLPEKLHKRINI